MTFSAACEPSPERAQACPSPAAACDDDHVAEPGRAIYLLLTGREPGDADIEDNHRFDEHIFASILAVAALEGGSIGQRVGLVAGDLAGLAERWFPHLREAILRWSSEAPHAEDDEVAMVRELLMANRSTDCPESRWLALMVARRALEANHLWEDLGLRNRNELSRLLMRHFAPLARRNTRGMRWKRFFYRMLCEDDGFLICSTPGCTDCPDFDDCFGEESGESRLARRRRDSSLNATAV